MNKCAEEQDQLVKAFAAKTRPAGADICGGNRTNT